MVCKENLCANCSVCFTCLIIARYCDWRFAVPNGYNIGNGFLIIDHSLAGQTQQVVTQIIRGQPVSTAVSSTSTSSSSAGQKTITSSGTPPQQTQPQTTPQPTRPQQGQVKLTMAQLTQLTQGQVKCFTASRHGNVLILIKPLGFSSVVYLLINVWFGLRMD